MKPEKKGGLRPKLRFPEFEAAGDWEEKKLSQIAKVVSDKATTSDKVLSLSSEYGLVLQNEYFGKKIAGENIERYIRIIFNDFVYNDRITKLFIYGTIKRLSQYKSGIVSPIYKCFRFNNGENPVFWEWYFESGTHETQLQSLVNEGARAGRFNISIEKFLSIAVWHPNIFEQQKIAECLASVDELITAEAEKIEALKIHKKGLLQQLFPAGGETTPSLRFPEFETAGEWQKRELSEFITERNQPSYDNTVLFSLTIEDGVTPKTERYERSFLVSNETNAYKMVFYDDFAYNPMNLRFGAIARYAGEKPVALSKYYNIFYCDKTVNSRFCELYFKSYGMLMFYNKMATGTLIEKKRVHFSDFLKFKIPFPSLLEQQKIADCLASLDELITAHTQKLEALKTHKKGLMQQLFPSNGGVAGEA